MLCITKKQMTNFITTQNQQLLWNTMCKIPIFNQFYDENNKITWFKTVIGNIYERNKELVLSTMDLRNLNKETVKYMIQMLKSQQQPQPQQQPLQTTQNDTYENLKNTYETMRKPPEPPERPKFGEPIEDTAIDNMEELIEKQRAERARDMNVLDAIDLNNKPLTNITNDDDKKSEKDTGNEVTNNKPKTVQWSDHIQYKVLSDRIELLERRYEEMIGLINVINNNVHMNQPDKFQQMPIQNQFDGALIVGDIIIQDDTLE